MSTDQFDTAAGDESATKTNTATDTATSEGEDLEKLRTQLAILEEENERLREEYRRATQARYRKTAFGLFAIGLVAVGAATVLTSVRDILLVLGAIGLFSGLVTYYLTPERVVTASVAEHVYSAAAANGDALVDELGLREDRIYTSSQQGTRLFIPQQADYTVPDNPQSLFVVGDSSTERGVALTATGEELLKEFQTALSGELSDDPHELMSQSIEGLTEQFELVESADADVDVTDEEQGRVSISLSGSALGDATRFDHPTSSFLATAFVQGLDRPVRVTTEETDDADAIVTLSWPVE